jgi:hypothetical protein
VPNDLQAIVGQKVVRFSLRTRDRRVAAVKAWDELVQATQYFAELRASRLADTQRRASRNRRQPERRRQFAVSSVLDFIFVRNSNATFGLLAVPRRSSRSGRKHPSESKL